METEIKKFISLIETKGFKLQTTAKLKRSEDDFIEDIVLKFKKQNFVIEIRTYVRELVIRFKNTSYNSDFIDIRTMMYYFELIDGNDNKKSFLSFLPSRQIQNSLIRDLEYYFLNAKLNEILKLLNDNNFEKTLKLINASKSKFSPEQFSKTYFSNKKKINSLLMKYKKGEN